MAERFFWLIAGAFAVWRVTHLLAAEDGPFQVFVRLRRAAGSGFLGELLDCFQCLSLWVAAPAAVWAGQTWPDRIVLWLAWSGGAILLDRAAPDGAALPDVVYYEGRGGNSDAMLRSSETTGANSDPGGD